MRRYASLWALCKRVPLVHIGGVSMWRPLQFLARVLPLKGSSSMSVDAAAKAEAEHLKQLDKEMGQDVFAHRMALCKWLPRLDSDLTDNARKHEVLGHNTTLLMQLVLLAHRLSQLLHAAVGGHFELGRPMERKMLTQVLGAVELLTFE